MAADTRSTDFMILILAVSFLALVQAAEKPKLHIRPDRNPILTPARLSFGLICDGYSEDGEFPDLKWFNPKGEEIRVNLEKLRTTLRTMLKLTLPNPSVEDSGIYKCSALYSNTLAVQEVKVEVYEIIQFEDCPEIQNLVVGQENGIKCRAVTYPKPVISWKKDGVAVKSDRITIDDFGLSISNVSIEDGGNYSIEAFIKETGHYRVKNIIVNVLTPPKIEDLPADFVVIQGEEYTITCDATGSEPLTYSWFDSDLRDLSSVSGYSVNEGRLTISKMERNAGGEYICKVTNPAGEDTATVKIEVQVRPNIIQLENLTVEEGKDAIFECKAEGVPKPVMSVRKDSSDEDITDDPEEGIELEVFEDGEYNHLRLRMTNVKRSDDGLYFCKAANAAGVAERKGHLQVQFRPDMSRTQITSVKTWSDNPANLSCIAEAIPNATITWKFQGDPIEQYDERFKIVGFHSYSSLLVVTEVMEDYDVFGSYTCEARNALGENSVTINLEKAYRPSPLTQIVFDKVSPTTITFRFMGPSNTGGMPITHYNMKYRLAEQKDDPFKEVTWEKGAPYILYNLIPNAKYQFSAAAINVVGIGNYKDALYIMPEEIASTTYHYNSKK